MSVNFLMKCFFPLEVFKVLAPKNRKQNGMFLITVSNQYISSEQYSLSFAHVVLLLNVLGALFKQEQNVQVGIVKKVRCSTFWWEQGLANVNNSWRLHRQLTICLFSQHSQGAREDNNVMMPIHIISQWSDQQNIIKWELEQKARAAWAAMCCDHS